MVFQSVMAFHVTKTVAKIPVVRNEMGDHQIQVSGLEFKFRVAAPKHFSPNKQPKKSRQPLISIGNFPQPFAAVIGTAICWV